MDFKGSLLSSEDDQNNTSFLRHTTTLSKDFRYITIGARNDQWAEIVSGLNEGDKVVLRTSARQQSAMGLGG